MQIRGTSAHQKSPSSRRAWIEISGSRIRRSTACVALLAEGVDRNFAQLYTYTSYANVALLAEGVDRNSIDQAAIIRMTSRPPRGGRG